MHLYLFSNKVMIAILISIKPNIHIFIINISNLFRNWLTYCLSNIYAKNSFFKVIINLIICSEKEQFILRKVIYMNNMNVWTCDSLWQVMGVWMKLYKH